MTPEAPPAASEALSGTAETPGARRIAAAFARAAVIGAQMIPLPYRARKFMVPASTNCAAQMKSPSFSLLSSSRTMTIFPLRIASTASSI